MSESQKFMVTFKDVSSYRKYKEEVLQGGGTITRDLGENILGFIAIIPAAVVQTMRFGSLVDNGITSFERDSVVTTQDK